MSVKHKTLNGFIWNFLGAAWKGGMTLLITALLSRMLPVKSFGLLALILATTSISTIFIDCGLSQSIIRTKNLNTRELSTVFYINLLIAVVAYVMLYSITPWWLAMFSYSGYEREVRVAFLIILFDAAALIQTSLYSKALNFRTITVTTIASAAVAASVAIILAYCKFGFWSLTANITLNSAIRCALLWLFSPWRPKLTFSFSDMEKHFNFGGFLLLAGMIDHACTSLETFVVGKCYPRRTLSFVSRAKELDEQLNRSPITLIQKVIYPALATIEGADRLKLTCRTTLRVMLFVTMFAATFVFSCSDNLIQALYGSSWSGVAVFLRLVCLQTLFYSSQMLCTNIFLLKERTGLYFKVSMWKQVTRVVVLLICCHYSVYVTVWGIVLVNIFGSLLLIGFSMPLLAYELHEFLSDVLPTFLVALSSAGAAYGANLLTTGHGAWIRLIVQGTVMGGVYLLLAFGFRLPGLGSIVTIAREYWAKFKGGGMTCLDPAK